MRDEPKKIELGGKEGEYQYKLKQGDVFDLEDPGTHVKTKLKLDDSGKLQIVKSAKARWKSAITKAKRVSKGIAIAGARSITDPYYLEVLPIRLPAKDGEPEVVVHLYRELLDYEGGRYRERWLASNTQKSFQDYMYEDIGPNLTQEERQKILSNNIELLSEQEKVMKYATALQLDGSITQNGKKLEDGEYMFVLDTKKQLFAAKKIRGKVHHSTLSSGQPVLSAGMMKVANGQISKVYGYSGHYKPLEENMVAIKEFMSSKFQEGVLSSIEIDLEGWKWGV